jgi:hypothetical protein
VVNTARHLGLNDGLTLARSGPAALARILARCREEGAECGGRQFQHANKTIVSV